MISIARKKELNSLIRLSFPIVLGQLAQTGMGFVDTVVAGKYGNNDLAAIAIGTSLWVPIYFFIIAVLMSISPKVAFSFGAKDDKGIVYTAQQGMWLAFLIGIFGFVMVRFSVALLTLMDMDPAVRMIAADYIHAVAWGLPAAAMYQSIRYYSESLNHTRTPMVISFIALSMNIVFNSIFVFGYLGVPAMGGVGCGWATALVMWSMLALMILLTVLLPGFKRHYLYQAFHRFDGAVVWDILKLGLPIGVSAFVEVSIFAAVALLIIPLGTNVISGHQIALNFSSLSFMLPYSISMGITVRVGQALGKGDPVKARFAGYTGMILSVVVATLTMIGIAAFAPSIAGIYTDDVDIIQIASGLLLFAAVYQLPDALQISASGALRGYKDTRTHMKVTIFSFWLIGIPMGYFLTYTGITAPMGVAGFWIALVTSLTVAAILLNVKLNRLSAQAIR